MKSFKKNGLALLVCVILTVNAVSALDAPKGAVPVSDFDVVQYLGKWFEIARLDFKHEKNMSDVTAEYTLNRCRTCSRSRRAGCRCSLRRSAGCRRSARSAEDRHFRCHAQRRW